MAVKKATKKTEEEKVVATEAVEEPQVEVKAEVEATEAETEKKPVKATAKAGKRSEKAIKEAEAVAEKEERKAKHDTSAQGEAKAKAKTIKPTRSRLERRGKNYRKAAELIEAGKFYSLKEAIELAIKTSVGKFDASVELHLNLNVDPRQADQNIRGTVSLPGGSGKTVRVAVFAGADQHEKAKKAGADIVGEDDFLAQLDKEQLNFDVLISTPQMMAKLGKYAKLLGPKGLMPNPKSGTVTPNVAKAVEEAKAGKVEYRVDKQSIIHQAVGKVSFGPEKLLTNAKAVIDAINGAKPASVKGALLKGMTASTTMGPGIKVDLSQL